MLKSLKETRVKFVAQQNDDRIAAAESMVDLLIMKGIYKQDGNKLVYCWGYPGQPRPADFTTPKDSNQTLVKLEKSYGNGLEKAVDTVAKAAKAYLLKTK